MTPIKAPFPYFGGKARAAPLIWEALGDVPNLVEPFAGSLAVLLGRPTPPHLETVNDACGFICVGPSTRILKADMSWEHAQHITPGERLLAFDEANTGPRFVLGAPAGYRHWRYTTVLDVQRIMRPAYRLRFDDGTEVVCSAEHTWLAGSHKPGHKGGRAWRWIPTKNMVCNRKTQRSWVMKLTHVVSREESYEAGWLGGFIDGEGHISPRKGFHITISQNPGILLDRAEQLLKDRGFATFRQLNKTCVALNINGGMRETLRLLMLVRPERLIAKCQDFIENNSIYGREHQAVGLVEKEYLGEQEVISITTDTHTFIAEGLASHNCNVWRAIQHDPDAVAHYADRPSNENDLHAIHSWLLAQRSPLTVRLEGDMDYYDARVAGLWMWGICCWIGSGWCSGNGTWQVVDGQLVKTEDAGGARHKLPHLGDAGRGVQRKRTHLGNAGQGVQRKRTHLGGGLNHVGNGMHSLAARNEGIYTWMRALCDRLRYVRVTCGDWTRVLGPSVTWKHGLTGVYLDPPYGHAERSKDLYAIDQDVTRDVQSWCVANGDNALLRIVLSGYENEYALPGWRQIAWKATAGYSGQNRGRENHNQDRETLWCSPHCVERQLTLFGGTP
jgi:hypothetical protein